MEHIVKIEGVCKKHGSKQILEDISFTASELHPKS